MSDALTRETVQALQQQTEAVRSAWDRIQGLVVTANRLPRQHGEREAQQITKALEAAAISLEYAGDFVAAANLQHRQGRQ